MKHMVIPVGPQRSRGSATAECDTVGKPSAPKIFNCTASCAKGFTNRATQPSNNFVVMPSIVVFIVRDLHVRRYLTLFRVCVAMHFSHEISYLLCHRRTFPPRKRCCLAFPKWFALDMNQTIATSRRHARTCECALCTQ